MSGVVESNVIVSMVRSTKSRRRRPLPVRIQNIVWGRAAGRCQYAGCNASLIGDDISGAANANKAYIGHIVSDAVDGPRGDPLLSPKLAHDPDNLMLVCDAHHRVFDREMVAEHPVEVLNEMKRRHEARIKIVTAIDEDLGSHVIRYAARIGTNESPVATSDVKWSMLPQRYPVDGWWTHRLDRIRAGRASRHNTCIGTDTRRNSPPCVCTIRFRMPGAPTNTLWTVSSRGRSNGFSFTKNGSRPANGRVAAAIQTTLRPA
jgi:hypothetical protein